MLKPKTVSSLICHAHVNLAVTCLGSLLKRSQEPIHLNLHDDGSLLVEDIEILSQELCFPTIVSKAEADEQMADALKKHPHALKFRDQSVFAKKLLDSVHFNRDEIFGYCDSDIWFFQDFSGLFALPSEEVNALFMEDMTQGYAVRSWQMALSKDFLLPRQVNAGLICYRRSCFDLDFIEWLLAKPQMFSNPYFTEQTIWAMLGWRNGCHLWDEDQVTLMMPHMTMTTERVAGHFVGKSRHLLDDFIKSTEHLTKDRPVQEFRTVPAQRLYAVQMAACETGRILERAWLHLSRS